MIYQLLKRLQYPLLCLHKTSYSLYHFSISWQARRYYCSTVTRANRLCLTRPYLNESHVGKAFASCKLNYRCHIVFECLKKFVKVGTNNSTMIVLNLGQIITFWLGYVVSPSTTLLYWKMSTDLATNIILYSAIKQH